MTIKSLLSNVNSMTHHSFWGHDVIQTAIHAGTSVHRGDVSHPADPLNTARSSSPAGATTAANAASTKATIDSSQMSSADKAKMASTSPYPTTVYTGPMELLRNPLFLGAAALGLYFFVFRR